MVFTLMGSLDFVIFRLFSEPVSVQKYRKKYPDHSKNGGMNVESKFRRGLFYGSSLYLYSFIVCTLRKSLDLLIFGQNDNFRNVKFHFSLETLHLLTQKWGH